MNQPDVFFPPRLKGGLVFGSLSVLLWAGGGTIFMLALQQSSGSTFVLYILAVLVLLAPTPFLIYSGYSLLRANYALDPDGLRLRWGLRSEDIPLDQVEWVRHVDDLGFRLPLPAFHFAGILRARLKVEELGTVEFMASDTRRLLLVATPQVVYAISPADMRRFLALFQDAFERGSLTPIRAASSLPAAFVRSVWTDRAARLLVLSGLILTMGLVLMVALLIPMLQSVSLGFDVQQRPVPPGPPETLLLLPILAAILFTVDLIVGMFFYHRSGRQAVAYMVWTGSLVTPLILMLAVMVLEKT